MNIEKIIFEVQDKYNNLGVHLEQLTRNIVSLHAYELGQEKTIEEFKLQLKAQQAIITQLKSAPIFIPEYPDPNPPANLISCPSKPLEPLNEAKIAQKPTICCEPATLKRKPEVKNTNPKKLKTQQTLDNFFPQNYFERPSAVLRVSSLENSISNNYLKPSGVPLKQQPLIKTLVDDEGYTILHNQKKQIVNTGANGSRRNEDYCSGIEEDQLENCKQCRGLFESLGDILEPHELKGMCTEHRYPSNKVPSWYFEVIK